MILDKVKPSRLLASLCAVWALPLAFGTFGALGAFGAPVPHEEETVRILFIHHSCGGQLLADEGPTVTPDGAPNAECIYLSHPNGGGLRVRLEASGFQVNEASYGSLVGEDTDIRHWHAKFRDQMPRILATRHQDELLPDGQTNDVVLFKSCYPNNRFVGMGTPPGNPESAELTVSNAQAAYRSVLSYFAEHPAVLFVAVTAPPRAEPKPRTWRARIKRWFQGAPKDADLARRFNTWLADPRAGWLADYSGENVAVFDLYDVLTDGGATNWSAYPTRDGKDSHPSADGNAKAAAELIVFLNNALAGRAVP